MRSDSSSKTYDIPLLKYAAGLPEQLNNAVPPGGFGSSQFSHLVERHLSQEGMDGQKYKRVRVFDLPEMHYETLLALPAILQDTYDNLLPKDKPPVKFCVGVHARYKKGSESAVHIANHIFGPEAWKSEHMRDQYNKFWADETIAKTMNMYILVAFPEQEVQLPASQMRRFIGDTHEEMFDRGHYQFGEYKTALGVLAGGKLEPKPMYQSDRLLPVLAQVYGGATILKEGSRTAPHTMIVPDTVFDAMERGEMPDRYRGMGDLHQAS